MIVRGLLICLLPALLLVASPPTYAEKSADEEYRNTKVMVLEPFERAHGYPGKVTLKGRMQEGYQFSEALLVRADGSAIIVEGVETKGARFEATLKLARGRGIYRVALTGTTGRDRTHHGARILLFAGVPEDHPDEPPPKDVKPDKRIPADVLAADLFRRVNAHRKKVGVKSLEWQEPIAQAARLHAIECVKRKKLDHKFPEVGTVAWRVGETHGFDRVIYRRPRGKPSRGARAKSYLATVLDARRGLQPILHRWKRFAAFCVPMTSELMTHGACGIARTKGGSVYIVFVFAQINGTRIKKLTEAAQSAAVREVESKLTLDEERPAFMRALGLWMSKASRKLAAKYAKSEDVAIRAAALDMQLLEEPEDTRIVIEKGLDAAGREYAAYTAGASVPNRSLPLLLAAQRLQYAPDLRDRAGKVEKVREAAAKKALAAVLAAPTAGGELLPALKQVIADWPETAAAEAARKQL